MTDQSHKTPAIKQEESIKETFESIIIAFILAFVFRAYVLEPFVIPTGSMAPTLLGEHVRVQCEQCGYVFNCGITNDDPNRVKKEDGVDYGNWPCLTKKVALKCPMCNYSNIQPINKPISAGDRILALKYIYNYVEPRRWDVVIFKNPSLPHQNFIKRLVGLPNETIWIIEGNVYVKPKTADDSAWRIARKTDQPQAQKTMWQPVYHSRYIPMDLGLRDKTESDNWRVPWVAKAGEWKIENRRSYELTRSERGVIEFDYASFFSNGLTQYAYNQLQEDNANPEDQFEEVRLGATFAAESQGLAVKLQTTGRIDESSVIYELACEIDRDGNGRITARHPASKMIQTLAEGPVGTFKAGIGRRVEFWFVDQQLSLWIDGRQKLVKEFELPIEVIKERDPLAEKPTTKIEVSGSAVTLHEVNLDRDLHYATYLMYTTNGMTQYLNITRSVLNKRGGFIGRPVTMDDDQFFCLGDNSPLSYDSRRWVNVDPWIEKWLLSDRHPDPAGVVPRELMMGKALFVYWPAAYGFGEKKKAVLPNFGDMRFIN